MITCFHISDTDNLGDNVCCPADYVDWLKDANRLPISKFSSDHAGKNVIFGGGGLLHARLLEILQEFSRGVVWGAGMNEHQLRKPIHPKFLDKFALVGLRDYGNPWDFVPCPSCLHPAFDTIKASPEIAYGIYEHYDHPITIAGPKIQNRGKSDEFAGVLQWLSRCEILITNSYHGAYWAIMLGLKVLLYKPFSSRFYSFRLPLPELDEADWLTKILYWSRKPQEQAITLEKARWLNLEFSKRVQGVFNPPTESPIKLK